MANKLWTKDFTIITLGSVVSMLGNAISGFAISLLVLDFTQSNLLYALFIVAYTLPQVIMPVFSGAILDRFSRKRTIYSLDFISAGMYCFVAVTMLLGSFNIVFFLIYAFVVGSINSIYMVAYESFYPLLISEGNFQKAYSIASVLETLSAVMIPVSAFLYNSIGIEPLFFINAGCFLIAAIMETQIKTEEKYIEQQKQAIEGENVGHVKRMLMDTKEGFKYLSVEKGLLAVAIYFTFSAFSGGASSVITLPYFKSNYNNGEYIYMLVWGMSVVGRAIGGLVHYRLKIPAKFRYMTAFAVYCIISILEGSYLFLQIPLMMIMCFMIGIGGVTSFTIRVSATQSYVPDEKKGRFNGAFNMLNTVGSVAGEMIAGALTVIIEPRLVLSGFMFINLLAALFVIGRGKKHIEPIYNRLQ